MGAAAAETVLRAGGEAMAGRAISIVAFLIAASPGSVEAELRKRLDPRQAWPRRSPECARPRAADRRTGPPAAPKRTAPSGRTRAGPRAGRAGRGRSSPAQCDINVGAVICASRWLVAPPSTHSRTRE